MGVLVIKNDGIGDLIATAGVISQISGVLNKPVDLITCIENKEVAEKIPNLRKVHYVSRDAINIDSRKYEVFGHEDLDTIEHLKSTQYELALCLRRFMRQSTLILMKHVNAKDKHCCWQIPTNASEKMALDYSEGWERYESNIETVSEMELYKNFVESALNCKIDELPVLEGANDASKAGKSLENIKRIGVSIGGSSSRWQIGYWVELLKELKRNDYEIHLLGGNDVEFYSEILQTKIPDIDHNFIGKLSLEETVEKFKELDFVVANDTGLAHLSTLYAPTLVVLGGGTFQRFLPWTKSVFPQFVLYHGLDCFDCNWQCKHRERYCLNLVTAEDVAQYIESIRYNPETPRSLNLNPKQTEYQILWRELPNLKQRRLIEPGNFQLK